MTVFVFGAALRSDFSTLGIQMIYAITYYLLLANCADDYFSVGSLKEAFSDQRLMAVACRRLT